MEEMRAEGSEVEEKEGKREEEREVELRELGRRVEEMEERRRETILSRSRDLRLRAGH